jgi:hypothetical protein
MTPVEKAKELVDKYWIYLRANLLYDDEAKEDAKHCALIAVDEIINTRMSGVEFFYYWIDVKTEIEKL